MIAAIFPLLASCSANSEDSSPATVRQAIDAKDYALAAKILDNVKANLDETRMSAVQLAEMSVLAMKLDDLTPVNEDYASTAVIVYRKALEMSPDSVNKYTSSLGVDDTQYVFLLSSLARAQESGDIVEFEEEEY